MRHSVRFIVASLFGLAFGSAAAGIAYQDLPVVNSNFVSHHSVGGPVLADDFIPVKTGFITQVDWWGSQAQSSSWELTFHLNQDSVPTAPDAFPALTGGFKIFANSGGADPDGDGIFLFTAAIDDPNWFVNAGTSYWFSAANLAAGWTWAITDGTPEIGGEQFAAVQSLGSVPCPDGGPHCGAWVPLQGSVDAAFRITVPEPGSLALLAVAFVGLGAVHRRKT